MRERHFNKTKNALGAPTEMDFDGTVATDGTDGTPSSGTSGAHYINLLDFQRTRDAMRQGVMDLLNLNASLATMNVDGVSNGDVANPAPDFDTSNVYFLGHSLGAIIGTTFVAINNDAQVQEYRDLPKIQAVVLAHPGAQLPKLLENSPSFAPAILAGLAGAKLTQGSVNLEKFFTVFQATIDSADPINFAKKLVEGGTPVLVFEVVGGGTVAIGGLDGDAAKLAAYYVDGATYLSDSVVPNNATAAQMDSLNADLTATTKVDRPESAISPLAGTIGLTSQMGLTAIDAGTVGNPITTTPVQVHAKFIKGTHGSVASADDVSVFVEMMTQTLTFFGSNGMQAVALDATVLEAAPAAPAP
jgi:hypothetical protein